MRNHTTKRDGGDVVASQEPSSLLISVIQELSMARDLETVMHIVRSAARALTGADGATFVLRDGDRCFYADEDAIEPLWKGSRFPMSACISGWVMEHREPAVIEDIYADERIPQEVYRPTFVKSLAMVPIRSEAPVAAIGNYWAENHRATGEEVRLLQALADSASIAMENVQLYSDLERQVEERARAMEESEARYRALFEESPDAVLVLDAETGAVVQYNERALEHFGYSGEEMARLGVGDLEADESAAETAAHLERIRRMGEERFQTRHRRKDGEVRDASVYVRRIPFDGRPLVQAIFRDITECMRREAELEWEVAERTALNRELEAFSYSVSHDLRGPLRAVDGYSQVLEEDFGPALDDDARDYLHRMRNAVGRMHELMDGLLLLSRVTRRELEKREVDLSKLAAEVAEELAEAAPDRSVEWRVQPGGTARGDPGLLRVLLQNLLANAWKFTADRDPAVIEFGPVSTGQGEAYRVRDNGVGFDMKHADALFQPFQRLHAVQEYTGSGIGLATVQRIVKRHGGRIWAEAAPEQGAAFFFTLG